MAAAFEELCLRIHSNKLSSSDSESDEKSDYDEKYFSAKPPPIPYEEFQHNIVRLDSSEATEDASFVLPKNRRRNRRRRRQNALEEREKNRLVHKSSDVNWRQVQNEAKLSSPSCKSEGTRTKWLKDTNAYIDGARSFAEVVKTVHQSAAVAQKSQEAIKSEETISDDDNSQVPHKKKKRKRKKRNKRKSMKAEGDVGNEILEKTPVNRGDIKTARSGENVETSGHENSFSSRNGRLLDRAMNVKTSLFYENHSDSEDEWFAEETHKSDGWTNSAVNDETSHEKLFHGQNKRLLEMETSYHDEDCRVCRFSYDLEHLGIKSSPSSDEKLFPKNYLTNRSGRLLEKASQVRDENGADAEFGRDESDHLRLRPYKSDRWIKSPVNVKTSDGKHFREDSLASQNLEDNCRIVGVMQKEIKSAANVGEKLSRETTTEHLVLVLNKTSGGKNYFTSQNDVLPEKDALDPDRNSDDVLAVVPYKSDRGIDSPMDATFTFTRLMSVYLQFIVETIQNVINS